MSASGSVSGSRIPEQNTNGWQPYNTAVTVTGQTETDGRQTVAFLNTYTQTGEIILEKVDAMTGALMPGVSFTVAKQGGSALTIYRLPDGTYTTDSTAEGAKPVEGNVITTNANGQAFLHLGVGTFTFLEVVPTGYEDPGLITVTLGADGLQQINGVPEKISIHFSVLAKGTVVTQHRQIAVGSAQF